MSKKNIEISLIISSNYRSLIYLYYLKKNNLLPKKIVFLKDIREKKPELIDASKLYTELVDISDEGLEKSTVKLFDLSKANGFSD